MRKEEEKEEGGVGRAGWAGWVGQADACGCGRGESCCCPPTCRRDDEKVAGDGDDIVGVMDAAAAACHARDARTPLDNAENACRLGADEPAAAAEGVAACCGGFPLWYHLQDGLCASQSDSWHARPQ